MAKLLFFTFVMLHAGILLAQVSGDSVKKLAPAANADDPSQFFTRIEIYNELQRYDKKDVFLNQTVLRTVVQIGKKFTTRIDLPYVYNSFQSPSKFKQSGIGDISFRLLGFKFFEGRTSAFTSSIEVSMNTARSPLLGTGKNMLIPVISYTKLIPTRKLLLSLLLQQANSISGDENRADISFTKLQFIVIKYFSRRTWMVLAPEWFIDYINGGVSMNLRSRLTHAPTPRLNIWITPGAGVFGDFVGRYDWNLDVGGRYFLFRK
jgi:hypothetical protein